MKKTNEQYVSEATKMGLLPLEKYIDKKTSILHKCLLCGKEFNVTPTSVLRKTKYGCRSCGQRDTQETFEEKLKNINDKILVVGTYVDNKTKIKCRCLVDGCGCEWYQRPNDLLQGIGCPRCVGYERKTDVQFKEEFYKLSNMIELLSDYVNRRTPILCKCKIDAYEWYAYPNDLLSGRSGCRMCNGNAQYTTESFKIALQKVDPNIEIVGEYVNSKTPIDCTCKICGHNWKASPSNMLNNKTGCPNCVKSSRLEELVEFYFKEYNIEFERPKKFEGLTGIGGKPLSYDFYLPTYNYLFECQGVQHEHPIEYFGGKETFKIQQEHDKRKREYAEVHKIPLYEIWYYNKNDIRNILDKIFSKN